MGNPDELKTGGLAQQDEVEGGIETGEIHIDPKKEQKLIRKMDLHILPFVVLLYLFSFLDRGMSCLWTTITRSN